MSSKGLLLSGILLSMMRRNFRISFLYILIVFTYLIPFDTMGQGNLLVTPRRVVFEGNTRSFDLNLANTGQDSATYAISMVQIRMNEDGSFETITDPDPGQNFADKNIRFFPRSVTLPPNEAQVVKVQLLRANDLKPGEYRSHFYFRSIPKVVALGEEDETEIDTTSISVRLVPVFGITIPAIIRVGSSNTEVTLSDLAIEINDGSNPKLGLKFNRTGNFSVYGDLAVDHVSSDGTITRVGIANGIAVYTPNSERYFQFDLNRIPGVDFKSGKLLVGFSASSDVKPEKFAEAELSLN
jgi:hypothetical protein